MDRNQQTKTYRRDLLSPLKKPLFTERFVSLSDGGKKCVKASYNFDLRSQDFEKRGNGSEEIACRRQKKNMVW